MTMYHTINQYYSFAKCQVFCVRKKLLNYFIVIKKVIWTDGEGEKKYDQAASESVKVLKNDFFFNYRSCFYINSLQCDI